MVLIQVVCGPHFDKHGQKGLVLSLNFTLSVTSLSLIPTNVQPKLTKQQLQSRVLYLNVPQKLFFKMASLFIFSKSILIISYLSELWIHCPCYPSKNLDSINLSQLHALFLSSLESLPFCPFPSSVLHFRPLKFLINN